LLRLLPYTALFVNNNYMIGKLLAQLQAVVPAGMEVPEPIVLLYDWIEQQGYYTDDAEGQRVGFLYPEQRLHDVWTEYGRPGGTAIEFVACGGQDLHPWFGGNEPLQRRPCVFAQTGADGSVAAFWLSKDDQLKIVHMGSGSGSVLTCVLADNAVDFLRLLAIGYDELCWNDEFSAPPNTRNPDFTVEPNEIFQQWVRDTFQVTIPAIASEIVRHPAEMGDEDSGDEFCDWCNHVDG
jgi:hypothetical protein